MKETIRTITAVILAIVIGVTVCGAVYAEEAANDGYSHIADIDNDGEITAKDARAALRMAVNIDTADAETVCAADCVPDGKVDAEDAREILRIAVNIDSLGNALSEYITEEQALDDKTHSFTWSVGGSSYTVTEECRYTETEDVKATCLNAGKATYTCAVCGNSYTNDTPQLAHNYWGTVKSNGDGTHSFICTNGCGQYGRAYTCVYTTEVIKPASCGVTGVTRYTCKYCGYSFESANIPALSHSFTNYVYNNDATWKSDGTKTAVCDNGCGTKSTIGAYGTKLNSTYIPSSQKVLYITFDDGPSKYTGTIINTLKKYNAKATWFVISTSYTSGYKAITDSGNAIGLHSYTHDYKTIYSSTTAFYNDLQKISDKVYSLTGVRTYLYRFPGGSSNTVSRSYCKGIMTSLTKSVQQKGYVYFDWNSANDDATGESLTASQIYQRAIKYCNQSNRLVMLMHDTNAKGTTVSSLGDIIQYYQNHGYVCLALDKYATTAHHNVAN